MTLGASQARQAGFSPRFGAAAGCPYIVRQSGPGDTVAWKAMEVLACQERWSWEYGNPKQES